MVGGGEGAFIGGVHRMAARIDDQWELTAGNFQSDPENPWRSARASASHQTAAMAIFRTMAARAKPNGRIGSKRVAIVTPNSTHHAIAREFLNVGIPVICDKPMTTTVEARGRSRRSAEAQPACPSS